MTSGTQTTESFFSEDEDIESAIGLVVDTCHAAIQDLGTGRAHSAQAKLDIQQGCIERPRQACVDSARLHVGHTHHGKVDATYTGQQSVHGVVLLVTTAL